MLKVERRHFSPITALARNEVPFISNHRQTSNRRGSASSGKSNYQSPRKTPSPNAEVRNLQLRSPTLVVGSPNTGTTGQSSPQRCSPNRMSPKGRLSPSKKTQLSDNSKPNTPNKNRNESDNYAGARFHNPPTPDVLPKPPTHWINSSCCSPTVNQMCSAPQLSLITMHLKGLLNVQA